MRRTVDRIGSSFTCAGGKRNEARRGRSIQRDSQHGSTRARRLPNSGRLVQLLLCGWRRLLVARSRQRLLLTLGQLLALRLIARRDLDVGIFLLDPNLGLLGQDLDFRLLLLIALELNIGRHLLLALPALRLSTLELKVRLTHHDLDVRVELLDLNLRVRHLDLDLGLGQAHRDDRLRDAHGDLRGLLLDDHLRLRLVDGDPRRHLLLRLRAVLSLLITGLRLVAGLRHLPATGVARRRLGSGLGLRLPLLAGLRLVAGLGHQWATRLPSLFRLATGLGLLGLLTALRGLQPIRLLLGVNQVVELGDHVHAAFLVAGIGQKASTLNHVVDVALPLRVELRLPQLLLNLIEPLRALLLRDRRPCKQDSRGCAGQQGAA
jgi:hypothetical protein